MIGEREGEKERKQHWTIGKKTQKILPNVLRTTVMIIMTTFLNPNMLDMRICVLVCFGMKDEHADAVKRNDG